MAKRKVVLYISMSLDGYIAGENDDLSFLDAMQKEGEDYGYAEFTKEVDTYIVGRKTYAKVMDMINMFPQAEQYDCYVLTRQDIPDTDNITFYRGDIRELIASIRQKEGGNIYCDGGAEVVKLFMEHDLIDEYIISVIPAILGQGTRLFKGGSPALAIRFVSVQHYETGLVQLRYVRERN
ncbi:MAG: dihydrofolate reductase family protein [Bacteroidota bacterium]